MGTYSAPPHTHGAPPTQGYAAPPTQGYAAPPTQGYAAPQNQDYGAPMSYGYGAAPNHGYGYGPPSSSPYYPPYGGMMSPYGSPFGSPFGQGVTLSPRKMMMARMILAQDGLEQDEVVKILMMQHQDPWTMQEIAFVINIMNSKECEEGDQNCDDADQNSAKNRLEQLVAAMYGFGNRKLSVDVSYGSVPAEWQYLNKYHGIRHPLANTWFGPGYGLPGLPSHLAHTAPSSPYGVPAGPYYGVANGQAAVPGYTPGYGPPPTYGPLPTYGPPPTYGQAPAPQQPAPLQPQAGAEEPAPVT